MCCSIVLRLDLLENGKGLPHQPGNPLPQPVVQAIDVTRHTAIFADSLVPFVRNDRDVGFPEVRTLTPL
jgi:hypothetical protein